MSSQANIIIPSVYHVKESEEHFYFDDSCYDFHIVKKNMHRTYDDDEDSHMQFTDEASLHTTIYGENELLDILYGE